MTLLIIFFASGAGIALLVYAKVRQLQTKRTPLLLRVISLGDVHMKELSHRSAHLYADKKEEARVFITKQLPLRAKNEWYKLVARLEERARVWAHEMRNSRVFKKEGGISEYFKTLAESEEKKEEGSQNSENTVE